MTDDALQAFIPLAFRRRKNRWRADAGEPQHDARIIDALARAAYWQSLLDAGVFGSVGALARAEGLASTTVGRVLRLARLAPDLVQHILAGTQPRRLTLLWLMRHDIPPLWSEQREVLARLA